MEMDLETGPQNSANCTSYLEVREAFNNPFPKRNAEIIPILPNDCFYLGRNVSTCRRAWEDPTISNKHLQIRCVVFEEDATSGIAPLIYAEDLSTNGTQFGRLCDFTGSVTHDLPARIRRKSGGILLNDGDTLKLGASVLLTYRSSVRLGRTGAQIDLVQQEERKWLNDHYKISMRKLGVGGFGCVFAAREVTSNRQVACKFIDLRGLKDELKKTFEMTMIGSKYFTDSMRESHRGTETPKKEDARRQKLLDEEYFLLLQKKFREFQTLKDLDHPNIIRLEKVFWSGNSIYIFQELVTGGDLFSFLEGKGGQLTDPEAAVIIQQILRAVDYLHDREIVHRDLKPDNVLMASSKDGIRVVLTDFGNARYLPGEGTAGQTREMRKQRMFSIVGTWEYAAPEIHMKNKQIPANLGYSKAVDMWSIGCITAALLTGDVLFIDRSHPLYSQDPAQVILDLAANCNLDVLQEGEQWKDVGRRPKDFIRKLLVLNETQRMNVKEALIHKWFTSPCYAAEFRAVYERACSDWRPRRKPFNLVEPLKHPGGSFQDQEDDSVKEPLRSRRRLVEGPPSPSKSFRPHLSTIVEDLEDLEFMQDLVIRSDSTESSINLTGRLAYNSAPELNECYSENASFQFSNLPQHSGIELSSYGRYGRPDPNSEEDNLNEPPSCLTDTNCNASGHGGSVTMGAHPAESNVTNVVRKRCISISQEGELVSGVKRPRSD
ncbi:kinase-like protein [Patellaria atrata CBS 101060]|uniref:Kinase-like protein n=1 Tax=Patellaria atrata CBS 101060 TaxID=1346257 RepID=A0A9P4SEM5_9PEZI|nr:kinase-like protein [Patellaria atrata CBS 101060]